MAVFHLARTTEDNHPRFFAGWTVLLGCWLVTVANGALFWMFGIFFKPLTEHFGWSRAELSLVNTSFLLAYAPGAILWGRIADRIGPRQVLWAASLLVLVGYLGSSRVDSRTPLIIFYALVGLGTSATLGLPVATVQRWFLKWRGLMLGFVASGTGIGSLIFAPLANRLIQGYDWRTAYVVLGIALGLLLATGASLMLHSPERKGLAPYGGRSPDPTPSPTLNQAQHGFRTREALRTKAFWGLGTLHVLSLMPTLFFTTHLVPYATDKGISAAAAAQGLGLMGAVGVLGRLLTGAAADRIGWMRGVAIANFMTALATLGLLFANTTWMFYVFMVVFGLFNWGNLSLLSGAVSMFFGTVALGELLGYTLAISVVSGSVSPVMGGLIFDWTGSYVIFFLFALGCYISGAVYSLVLKAPTGRKT